MSDKFLIDQETLSKALEKINRERKEAEQARWRKRLKIAAVCIGIIVAGAGLFAIAKKGRENKEKHSTEVNPVSLTSTEQDPEIVITPEFLEMEEDDIQVVPGPFDYAPNWIHTQEESNYFGDPNGTSTFYGYVNGDGNTEWYTEDGWLDCTTSTPSEDSLEWDTDIWEGNVVRFDEAM